MTGAGDDDRPGSDAAHARRFIALPLPPAVRLTLQQHIDPMGGTAPDLRWTRPEGWHLTLAFLGMVPDTKVDAIAAAVGDAIVGLERPTRLQLTTPGRFGDRVLWVGVADDPPGTLAGLAEAARDAVHRLDIEVAATPFRAHVTLARAGQTTRVTSAVTEDLAGGSSPPWEPDSVHLWRSEPGTGAARYVVDAVISLT